MRRAIVMLMGLAACTEPPPPVAPVTPGVDGGCPSCVTPPDDAGVSGDAAAVLLPDLSVDEEALARSIVITPASIGPASCALQEGCVGAPGNRRLLRFTTSTPNLGDADLVVGDPRATDGFELSACHGHFHFSGYADYQLVDGDGGVAALGRKQAFCISDTSPAVRDAGPGKFTCDNQGLTRGWKDSYVSTLDCQWIDVTDVPPGDYTLRVEVNPERLFDEKSFENNVARVPVTIPSDGACVPRAEVCHDGKDSDCDEVVDNGCEPLTGNAACGSAFPVEQGTYFARIGEGSSSFTCAQGAAAYFSFQLTAAEMVFLSTHGSEGDARLVLLDGNCGTEHACVDGTCGAGTGHLVRALEEGDYTVAVVGAPGARVQLKITRAPCVEARVVGELPVGLAGNTSDALNTTRTSCGFGDGPEEHFVMATCPSDEAITFSTCGGTGFDSVIQVREDSCQAQGTMSLCNDDGFPVCTTGAQSSTLHATLKGNTMHFISVDGFDAMDRGAYTLMITRD